MVQAGRFNRVKKIYVNSNTGLVFKFNSFNTLLVQLEHTRRVSPGEAARLKTFPCGVIMFIMRNAYV